MCCLYPNLFCGKTLNPFFQPAASQRLPIQLTRKNVQETLVCHVHVCHVPGLTILISHPTVVLRLGLPKHEIKAAKSTPHETEIMRQYTVAILDLPVTRIKRKFHKRASGGCPPPSRMWTPSLCSFVGGSPYLDLPNCVFFMPFREKLLFQTNNTFLCLQPLFTLLLFWDKSTKAKRRQYPTKRRQYPTKRALSPTMFSAKLETTRLQ